VPAKYAFQPLMLNSMLKTNAFVSFVPDGTAILQHAGIEMGQGMHTKLMQICAHELGIPIESVFVPGVSGYGVPNGIFSGGSMGTDLNGDAIKLACKEINDRLAPLKKQMPDKTVQEVVAAAAKAGINLSGQGFRDKQPWADPRTSHDFLYFSFNAAVCEVELDVLTGHYRTLRADVIQDVGQSLSPMIDIGQVEGGFVQGCSYLTVEDLEILYGNDAVPRFSAESYEISSFRDIPVDFRVELTPGILNPHAVHSSKGIGEPPYCLGIATIIALRDAINSARAEHTGKTDWVSLNLPLTRSRVIRALGEVNAAACHSSQEVVAPKQPKNSEE